MYILHFILYYLHISCDRVLKGTVLLLASVLMVAAGAVYTILHSCKNAEDEYKRIPVDNIIVESVRWEQRFTCGFRRIENFTDGLWHYQVVSGKRTTPAAPRVPNNVVTPPLHVSASDTRA